MYTVRSAVSIAERLTGRAGEIADPEMKKDDPM